MELWERWTGRTREKKGNRETEKREILKESDKHTHTEREREREIFRESDKHTHGDKRYIERERQTQTIRDREVLKERAANTDRQTDRHREDKLNIILRDRSRDT